MRRLRPSAPPRPPPSAPLLEDGGAHDAGEDGGPGGPRARAHIKHVDQAAAGRGVPGGACHGLKGEGAPAQQPFRPLLPTRHFQNRRAGSLKDVCDRDQHRRAPDPPVGDVPQAAARAGGRGAPAQRGDLRSGRAVVREPGILQGAPRTKPHPQISCTHPTLCCHPPEHCSLTQNNSTAHLREPQHCGGHAQVAVRAKEAVPAAADHEAQGQADDAQEHAQALGGPAAGSTVGD